MSSVVLTRSETRVPANGQIVRRLTDSAGRMERCFIVTYLDGSAGTSVSANPLVSSRTLGRHTVPLCCPIYLRQRVMPTDNPPTDTRAMLGTAGRQSTYLAKNPAADDESSTPTITPNPCRRLRCFGGALTVTTLQQSRMSSRLPVSCIRSDITTSSQPMSVSDSLGSTD